jgi:hypothetical protein
MTGAVNWRCPIIPSCVFRKVVGYADWVTGALTKQIARWSFKGPAERCRRVRQSTAVREILQRLSPTTFESAGAMSLALKIWAWKM